MPNRKYNLHSLINFRIYLIMFVQLKNTKLSEKTAVQLVENVRQGFKVVQKVIRHLGYA